MPQDQSPGAAAVAGDFGFEVRTTSDPAKKLRMLTAEIAYCRLAGTAITGAGPTGSAWGDWALYTVSPLLAFESELGVQDPVGLWGPAGLVTDGSMENFAWKRLAELKHGRESMLGTMGYTTPELPGKLPGYLSPLAGLKFADAPNELGAISKVPAAGWAQILACDAFCELPPDQSPRTAAAGGGFVRGYATTKL